MKKHTISHLQKSRKEGYTFYRNHILILLLGCFITGVFQVQAQIADSPIDKQFEEIKKKLRVTIDAHLLKTSAEQAPANVNLLNPLYSITGSDAASDMHNRMYQAERRFEAKDKGFRIVGSYADNFNANSSDEIGYVYKRVVQTGLEWNILNNGLAGNRINLKEFKTNAKIKNLIYDRQIRSNNSIELVNNITSIFTRYKIQKLNDLLVLLNQQIEISKKIYYLKFISWEEVTELLTRKAEVETSIRNFIPQVRTTPFDTVSVANLPIVDVNLDKLIAVYKANQKNDTLAELRTKAAYYQNKTIKEVAFKTSLKYNYYDSRVLIADRNFMSFGATLSIPFPLQSHVNKQLTQIQREEYAFESKEQINEELNILFNDYNIYKNNLKQYIKVYQTRALLQNKIRIESNKEALDDPSYSPIRIVAMIAELLASEIDLIDKQQATYTSLVTIYKHLPAGNVTDFIEPVNLDDFVPKRSTDRRLYIWYSTFKETDNNFIYQYIKNNEIKGVMLGLGEYLELKVKGEDLIKMLRKDNIPVQIIYSNKELIDPTNSTALVNALAAASKIQGIRGIHLDVDVSNFPDYIANRQKYAEYYINMIKVAQIYLKDKNLRLTVSLPLTYDSGKLDSVFSLVDKVYLYANDNKEETFIKGKIQSKFAKLKDKIVVVLRTSNFYDRFSFEDYIERLSKSIKVNNFAVNDLKGLLILEDRVFNKLDK
ncbi:MAG TPA: hypothetical protein PLN13_01535 [Bacteroidia bacterium]|nr:hypothetical protein [Bacteroidia bacterium]HRH07236.1 hypothetical protein [Bacteroidia bacterium]